jgi:hypothetical protein
MIRTQPALSAIFISSLLTGAARADEPAQQAPPPAPAAEPQPWYKRVSLHGYADVYYSYNLNRPADRANFIPGVGTTGKRDNEFSLNLGALELNLDPEPLGVRLVLNYGTGTEILHAAELEGTGVGPAVWRFVQEASLSYKAPIGNGVIITGGIYPCHIGLEVLASRDNWNYTRSWVSDLAPFYQTGVRISYPFTRNFSAQLHVVNGWNVVADNNSAKSLGLQLMWNSDRLQIAVNALVGPELARDDEHWRFLGDVFVVGRPARWFNLAAVFDVGYQQIPLVPESPEGTLWYAAEGYLQFVPVKQLSVTLRGGFFHDPDNGISGTAQTLGEATATVEVRPLDGLSVKLEGRHDRSTAAVFHTGERDETGAILKSTTQTLLMLGGVAWF